MKKYIKTLPLWVKTGMIFGVIGLMVHIMQSANPSLLHVNLVAATFGVIAYTVL